MASLSLRGVSKVYRRVYKAVENFNLEIDDKEFVVLCDPSGSGKSAILHMIAGVESVTSGEILMDGRSIGDLPAKQRDVALVSHFRALNSFQTIRKNIESGLKGLPLSAQEIARRVDDTAQALELTELMDRKPKTLSSGEKQRVELARGLVRNPKVVLLDNPLANLDTRARARLRSMIRRLHESMQATFVLVTNDYRAAMTMGTRVIVMKDGKIQQSDTPQNLYDFPENRFVASFVGDPEMNLFRVKLEAVPGEGVYAVFGENRIHIPSGKLQRFISDAYIGKEVYMGIRPENLHDEAAFLSVAEEDTTLEVTVEHVELLGSQTMLYLTAAGLEQPLIAQVYPRSTARQGERITIGFDTNRLHFFDAETEKTILMRM